MLHEEIVLFEELNFNAWPALRTVHYDGWLLRSSGGDSRRVNSVNPIAAGSIGLEEKIPTAEAIYSRWGRRTIFRLTPLADAGLDEALVAMGYTLDAPTFVQIAEAQAYPSSPLVRMFDRADETWIGAALTIRGVSGENATVFAAQHRAIGIETGWALVEENGAVLAVGAVAVSRGWAGLHGIYVSKDVRRRGLARRLSEVLIGFAHAKGARRVWLQVELNNTAALSLYGGLGFGTAYAYHHRIQSEQRR